MLFEIQVFVPVADNDGQEFSKEEHEAFERRVEKLFGGCSLYPEQVIGRWRGPKGISYQDNLRVYGIAVKGLKSVAKIVTLIEFAKTHYQQKKIFVRYLGVAEVL